MKKIKILLLAIIFCLFINNFNRAHAFDTNIVDNSKTATYSSSIENNATYFRPYMKELQRRIKQNWELPKERLNQNEKTIFLFKIAKNGYLLGLRIFKSSGNSSFDDACKVAILKTAPFKPLPAEFNGKSINIKFTFDSNILNK